MKNQEGQEALANQHSPPPKSHWASLKERGGLTGLSMLFFVYRLLGRNIVRVFLYPIVAYFFMTGGVARRASLNFLSRLYAHAPEAVPKPSWRLSFLHFFSFAEAALDKLSAWLGDVSAEDIIVPESSVFERAERGERGLILLCSHIGNLELLRALALKATKIKLNIVLHTEATQSFNTMLGKISTDFSVNFIQVAHFGPDTAILLEEKIACGEWVAIAGDRIPIDEKSRRVARVDFLGAPAAFPEGPFILSSLLACPVYLFFCVREGKKFRIYLEAFAEKITLPRANRAAALADYMQRYVKRLEDYCVKAPLQWFNFYDFWR